jgi:hypothetical protein
MNTGSTWTALAKSSWRLFLAVMKHALGSHLRGNHARADVLDGFNAH